MTVTVVPILRLRRATTGWSYKVPANSNIQPGALVIVPFRNRATLGIVWAIEESGKATLPVTEILTHTPLVRAPHRELIGWMAEEAICSLSTALYSWLPAALRAFPLTKPVRDVLGSWDAKQPTSKELALCKQHAVLVPSRREAAEMSLERKYKEAFRSSFADTTPAQEFLTWTAVAQGTCQILTGREHALYAPWVNLRHISVIEPEDISYHTGQSPYLNLVKGAEVLTKASNAHLNERTSIPIEAAQQIWEAATGFPTEIPEVELTSLRNERILNPRLISRIQDTLASGQQVLILYNAHDRWKQEDDGSKVVIPGIETLGRQLAGFLGIETLPSTVHLGTRTILHSLPENIGLSVVLSLDPLLGQTGFADQLHGWGDLGRLCQIGKPIHIQTRHPEDDLPQSLARKTFEQYCLRRIEEAKAAQLPPFSEYIVCAYTGEDDEPQRLTEELEGLLSTPWIVGYPREVLRRGKKHTIITINAPKGTRLPLPVRKILASLPRPWKVERDAWYAG